MDNITHSLIGCAAGELAFRLTPEKKRSPHLQALLWFVSWVSNNAADLDYIYYWILQGSRLDIILHHRGITHSFVMSLPQVLVALIPAWLLVRFLKLEILRFQWLLILVVSALGTLLHVGLDFLNSYGVHPYWPLSNRWVYGDLIFVVEVWFWVSLLPSLYKAAPWRWMKILCALLGLAGMGLLWFTGFVPLTMGIVVTLWGLGVCGIVFLRDTRIAVVHGIFAFLTVVAVFKIMEHNVRAKIAQDFTELKGTVLKDLALSPSPSNPFCWSVIAVSTSSLGSYYQIRKALVTPVPSLVSATQCPTIRENFGKPESRSRVHWFYETERKVDELVRWKDSHCEVRAFLRFSRMPLLEEHETTVEVDDARFRWGDHPGFAHFVFQKTPERCPKFTVPWEFPRSDLWTSAP